MNARPVVRSAADFLLPPPDASRLDLIDGHQERMTQGLGVLSALLATFATADGQTYSSLSFDQLENTIWAARSLFDEAARLSERAFEPHPTFTAEPAACSLQEAGAAVGMSRTDPSSGKVWFRVLTDGMDGADERGRNFAPGTMVLVDVGAPPRDGCLVIAALGPGKSSLLRYREQAGETWLEDQPARGAARKVSGRFEVFGVVAATFTPERDERERPA